MNFLYLLPGIALIVAGIVFLIIQCTRKSRFDSETTGIVTRHTWSQTSEDPESSRPVAHLEYFVDEKKYKVRHRFHSYVYIRGGHAEQNWVVDDKYRLCHYRTKNCDRKINPIEEIFPVGTEMTVHYSSRNPKISWCGEPVNFIVIIIVLFLVGIGLIILEMLLI